MADLIGRRYGEKKWWFSHTKSYVGSLAFVLSSFGVCLGLLGWFHAAGCIAVSVGGAAARVAAISVACALVELTSGGQPGGGVLSDDNISVPIAAACLGRLLFG
ncbi:unnamed protein product [Discosporangium mesarthrocarpum]